MILSRVRKVSHDDSMFLKLSEGVSTSTGFDYKSILRKKYKITNLICMNRSSKDLNFLLKGNEVCTTIGNKISRNIIRVASKRIFADEYRSFVEPITNGIDSYRELRNENKGVGKFGMGFFSLLYWLNDRCFMSIMTTYEENGIFYSYTCTINYSDDNYIFSLDGYSVSNESKKTGTRITLMNIGINEKRLKNTLKRAFSFIDDVIISILDGKTEIINYHQPKTHDTVNIEIISSGVIAFSDEAKGIPLNVLFNSLLVPTISTKTLLSFSGRKIELTNYTNIVDNLYINDEDQITSEFLILVGDIGIYNNFITSSVLNIQDVSLGSAKTISKKRRRLTYVLGLPARTPLPVSRDDVVLENQVFYDITTKEIEKLILLAIDKNGNIDDIIKHLKIWSGDSTDKYVQDIIDHIEKFILTVENIILVPVSTGDFYNEKILPLMEPKIPYVESKFFNNQILRNNIIKLKKLSTNLLRDKIVIPIDTDVIESGGLSDVLFVPLNYANLKDWESKLVMSYSIPVIPSKEALPEDFRRTIDFFDRCGFMGNVYSRNRIMLMSHLNSFLEIINYYVIYHDTPGRSLVSPYLYIIRCNSIRSEPFIDKTEITTDYTKAYEHFYELVKFSYFLFRNEEYISKVISLVRSLFVNFTKRKTLIQSTKIIINFQSSFFSEDSYYFVKSKIQANYVLEYIYFYYNSKLSSDDYYNYIPTVSVDFLLKNNYRNHQDMAPMIMDFIFSKNFIYSKFIIDILNSVDKISNYQFILNYIYSELNKKYSLLELHDALEYSFRKSEYVKYKFIINNITISVNLYVSLNNDKIDYKEISLPKFNYEFTATELINYVYENEIRDFSSFISELDTFVPKHQSTFQDLEIAVNDGTSKNYIDSVITELTQNSLDANRGRLKGRLLCNINKRLLDESYPNEIVSVLYQDGVLVREESGGKTPCPSVINLFIGEIYDNITDRHTQYGIIMTDRNGIPENGIISLMIPFLSSKSESEIESTGEMGTGFMNVYRQPFTKKVIIKTGDPNTKNLYNITATPIVKDNRVKDINYQIEIIKNGYKEETRKTEVLVIWNKMSKQNISSTIAQCFIFSYKFYKAIPSIAVVNGRKISSTLKLLLKNNEVEISMIEGSKTNSIMLTNGVPFSDLDSYIEEFENYFKEIAGYNMCVNLMKSSYRPVNSRKKLIIDDEKIRRKLNDNIKYAIVLKAINETLSGSIDPRSIFEGISYKGNPSQAIGIYSKGLISFGHFSEKIPSLSYIIAFVIKEVQLDKIKSYDEKTVRNKINKINEEKSHVIIPEKYIELVVLWFSNKKEGGGSFSLPEKTIKNKNITKEDEEMIIRFIEGIIKTVWNKGYNMTKNKQLSGLKGFTRIDPPKFFGGTIQEEGLLGFYDTRDHELSVDIIKVLRFGGAKIENFVKSLKTYKDKYNKSSVEANFFFRCDRNISVLVSTHLPVTTLVHELMHAYQGGDHEKGAHGIVNYRIGSTLFEDDFDNAASNLFLTLMSDYVPEYLS